MTKKRSDGDNGTSYEGAAASKKPRAKAPGLASRKPTAKTPARPRLRASHASVEGAPLGARKRTTTTPLAKRRTPIAPIGEKAAKAPTSSKRAPLGAPKRPGAKREGLPEPSSHARELAVSIAIAGLDKKAIAIEVLDVTGKVDYADFLVVMTGRSDRHVHSIATGIEDALVRKNKVKPLSVEGLSTASWVLIDFGDVVVHVFQEDARRLYDIEGLWIDAGRVALPENEQKIAEQIDSTGDSNFDG